METYLLFGLAGEKLNGRRIVVGFRLWIRCQRCGTRIVVRADCSLSHSTLRGRFGSGIDDRRILYMADKYTDDKLYKVVRKDGSHLNTKVNPDGTKSALQFTDDNNDLNGPVDLIEVDEEELIRTEYIQVLQNKRSLGELLVDEVVVPVIRDATTQLLEYGTAKAETWIEEKVVPVAKTKVKAGWENLKLFISTIKDSDKPIKATQIIAEQKSASNSSEIEVVNKVECGNKDEKKYVLSPGEVEILLDTARGSALMIAASLSILNNSVVMDDGTDPDRVAVIQRGSEQLSSKDITTQIDLLLDDKNSGLIDESSITMLRAFRDGMFIGNGTPIPVSRYTGDENLN
jgi:hypothetical protein